MSVFSPSRRACSFASALFLPLAFAQAQDPGLTLQQLADTNRQLQQQLAAQAKTISELQARMATLEQSRTDAAAAPTAAAAPAAGGDETVRLSAEVGLGYFQSGSDGAFPDGQFQVREARLYVEAPVWHSIFFHSELDLMTPEASDSNVHFGELYADIEDVPGPWSEGAVNLRLGRINIPFGEEYQVRNVMENPLISHSLSDIWGYDQGIEAYGKAAGISYAGGVLDGGINQLRNFHSSRSAAARIGYSGAKWWKVSASAMRTGRIASTGDQLSAVWFGNGFFRTVTTGAAQFWANLVEADAKVKWNGGAVNGAVGQAQANDSRPGDFRRLNYYYVEATQAFTPELYGAVRWSEIRAPGGYPLAGQGLMGEYFFSGLLTTRLQRLSVGAGYRFGDPVVLKVEYSPEWGRTAAGGGRGDEDLFSTELGLKF